MGVGPGHCVGLGLASASQDGVIAHLTPLRKERLISSGALLPFSPGKTLHPYVPFPGGAGIHAQHLLRARAASPPQGAQAKSAGGGCIPRVGELVSASAAHLLPSLQEGH